MKTKEELKHQEPTTSDIVREILKESLSIQISTKKEYDFGNEHTVIEVDIFLDGEKICEASDIIR